MRKVIKPITQQAPFPLGKVATLAPGASAGEHAGGNGGIGPVFKKEEQGDVCERGETAQGTGHLSEKVIA